METLDQGLAAALVLLGIAAMLYGVATLWRSVTDAKAQQQVLALDKESREMAFEDRVTRERSQRELIQALIPAGTALVGHWLGRQSLPTPPDPLAAPCVGCIPKPPPNHDDGTIEIDLHSLVDALGEIGFYRWLETQKYGATANAAEAAEHDDLEPTPDVVPGMS
ncbi:hypothetical protein [Paraliomyxa miuraensis]|uniref:hypothetical protein n=1 Tax=Paraliomyxa miuraensis TaxID=376150 RepID=UPI00225364CD|nr:hypothetical protein [Paraliomyxa miuraensis]MCX4239081.1 hypothetical protein [Paraliomyxa miuraensis]